MQNRLHRAYEKMLQRIHDFFKDPEQQTEATLHKTFENAKDTAVKLGEMTEDEAELIAESVKRDLHDAGIFMNNTGHALGDWLRFDLMLLEDKLRILFINAVDLTRIELAHMQQSGDKFVYRTGEVIGPGSITCQHCSEILTFKEVEHIPSCPTCSENLFTRL